jgi:hypothetical protein
MTCRKQKCFHSTTWSIGNPKLLSRKGDGYERPSGSRSIIAIDKGIIRDDLGAVRIECERHFPNPFLYHGAADITLARRVAAK